MIKPQVFLLAVLLAGLAQAQQWTSPEPQEFTVKTDEIEVCIIEEFREDEGGAKGKIFVRGMMIRYKVATSDRREDQVAALLLGAPNEDAARIDAAVYEGVSWAKSPELRYIVVKFYAGDDLIARKEIKRFDDPYNARANRIYERARLLYEKEKKPGSESSPRLVYGAADSLPRFPVINQRDSFTTGRRRSGRKRGKSEAAKNKKVRYIYRTLSP
jgi:hypothetical protein